MKFVLKNTSGENVVNLMRRVGYHFQRKDDEKGELIFTRPLRGVPYPRFHLYLKEDREAGEISISLHLDQKRPIYPVRSPSRYERDGSRPRRLTSNRVYKGTPAHSGEYEGEVVEKEAERIKQIFKS